MNSTDIERRKMERHYTDTKLPFYRVDYRSQVRQSYCDNTHSRSFDTEPEAISFAESLKGQYREILFIYGKNGRCWKFKTVAKWGRKKLNGKTVIGRIK
jgi:hypothetical protein